MVYQLHFTDYKSIQRWTVKQFGEIDIDILSKYSKPGPRYTSYPTAPAFTDFRAEDYLGELVRTNSSENSSDLSLYFHFPFCDTLCYFCACTMMVTHNRERINEYIQYLKKEIDLISPHISKNRKVAQIHWGGGSPTYLDPDEIIEIGFYIRKNFQFAEDVEASVEIDPRGLTRAHLQALRDCGFNRVSIGVQDFDSKVQKAVNRIQPEQITRDAIEWSRELGFNSINIDMIYGLPHQTIESFERSIDKVIEISPDRIAVFNYAHVPWLKPHQKLIRQEDLPSPQAKLKMFARTIEKLVNAGYWNIGMDHFAKETDEMVLAQKNRTLHRNFQGYSTKANCDLYGFGMSSIGHFGEVYAQNDKMLKYYYSWLEEGRPATQKGYRMTRDDQVRKETIMRIMCDMELEKSEIEDRFSIDFDEYFSGSLAQLDEFVADGLVTVTPEKIIVNGLGRLVIRNIAMCFDAYLERMTKEGPTFSKTV
jgi:oxygen-independent coproporphyrinogen III oxidase